MKNKIKTTIALLIASVLCTGCGIGDQILYSFIKDVQNDSGKVEDYEAVCGEVVDGVYRNSYFNLEYHPEKLEFKDDEFIENLYNMAMDIQESEGNVDPKVKQLMENNSALVMMAMSEEEATSMVAMVVRIPRGDRDSLTEEKIWETGTGDDALASLESQGVEDIQTQKGTTTFLSNDWPCISLSGTQQGYKMYQKHVMLRGNDYYIQFTATSFFEDKTERMLSEISLVE